MPFEIVRNDITKMHVDAIVNAANPALKMGGGVCGAIFHAAGAKELQVACDKIGGCAIGQAVITEGFKLPAKYVISTPGPIWHGGSKGEANLLKASYENALNLARQHRCDSIAFPLISAGIYGYPKEEALQIAVNTISSFLQTNDMLVYLVVFDKKAFWFSKKLFSTIHQFIDEHYVEKAETLSLNRNRIEEHYLAEPVYKEELIVLDVLEQMEHAPKKRNLTDLVNQLDETFSERLLRLIDEKGMTDAETYHRANIDRRLFSKIRNDVNYSPKKKTAIAFAIALQLNLDETIDLLGTAGYTLSHSSKFDVIIKYFIQEANYNIYEINEALFAFDQILLGA
ncbi:RNase III inhibitor [Bacillus sp. DNRA2]|uniref:macro domain-containing protein n=1 Tax=Bacillus sp. DNRA2 TaxID=2723053 RepID=UPI00145E92CE|nr:macro domain-containing protein [Bacillus sp. DNRA2]NMD71655.1 RNase III inhibitor [Bacillus sp. DNRA2]